MDPPGIKGYCCPENFERLHRCERLAEEKGVPVPQIAMAWIFNQPDLDVYALVSSTSPERMRMNIVASELKLTPRECAWLDLDGER